MDLQDLPATEKVWLVDHHLPVKPPGAKQCRVENIGPVCRCDQDDPGVAVEAVHLDEHLIERLFAFIVTATHAGTTMATNSIDFIDKHDRRSGLFGLLEQVAHSTGAAADEHFDEVRTRDRKDRHPGLASNGSGQQGLTCAGRAIEQHSLGDLCAQRAEPSGALQEVANLAEFFDRFVGARNICGESLVNCRALALPMLNMPPLIFVNTKTIRPTRINIGAIRNANSRQKFDDPKFVVTSTLGDASVRAIVSSSANSRGNVSSYSVPLVKMPAISWVRSRITADST